MDKPRLRFIHWSEKEGQAHKHFLEKAGYMVDFEKFTPAILQAMRIDSPDAVVIDLTRLPSHGRDIAVNLRVTKDTRHIPMLFVEGNTAKVEKIQELLPDAVYSTWKAIKQDLEVLMENPPENPVVPKDVFAGYSKSPLYKKLGISENATVALMDAPEGFVETFQELPPGVEFTENPEQRADVILWFNRSRDDLKTGLPTCKPLAKSGKLWILWPKKSSGVKSDLSQSVVRETGVSTGMTDYKICSVDKTWSGLCFTLKDD